MRRMAIRHPNRFPTGACAPVGIRGVSRHFYRLSPCGGQVPYVLLTRAPVSAPKGLSLDLHVLGLSLAFILSQDQTLRCCYLFSFLFLCKMCHGKRPSGVRCLLRLSDAQIYRYCYLCAKNLCDVDSVTFSCVTAAPLRSAAPSLSLTVPCLSQSFQ